MAKAVNKTPKKQAPGKKKETHSTVQKGTKGGKKSKEEKAKIIKN